LPDVPTVAESGVPGFEGYLWMGIVAPAGTPEPIAAKLAAAAQRIVASPDTQARFDKDGVEPVGNGPDEFRAQIAKEIAVWRELAKTTKITVD
jgi:tripartite-type tricarboxylate transporter receptor subunit TctC